MLVGVRLVHALPVDQILAKRHRPHLEHKRVALERLFADGGAKAGFTVGIFSINAIHKRI